MESKTKVISYDHRVEKFMLHIFNLFYNKKYEYFENINMQAHNICITDTKIYKMYIFSSTYICVNNIHISIKKYINDVDNSVIVIDYLLHPDINIYKSILLCAINIGVIISFSWLNLEWNKIPKNEIISFLYKLLPNTNKLSTNGKISCLSMFFTECVKYETQYKNILDCRIDNIFTTFCCDDIQNLLYVFPNLKSLKIKEHSILIDSSYLCCDYSDLLRIINNSNKNIKIKIYEI